MAVKRILYYPDEPLAVKAKPVASFGAKLERLVEDLFDTMRAYEGVGLAAPQVGVSKRVFVLQEPEREPMCFINPEILEQEGGEEAEEGCLSMPRVYAQVPRATRLKVRAKDALGEEFEMEALDFLARIIQHECDHLDGILFPERLDIITRQEILQEWAQVREQLLAEATEAKHAT